MNGLRWILLALGIAVVAGIYLWSAWRRREREDPDEPLDELDEALLKGLDVGRDAHGRGLDTDDLAAVGGLRGGRVDDDLGLDDLPDLIPGGDSEPELEPRSMPVNAKASRVYSVEPTPGSGIGEELVLALNVMAEPGQFFSGSEVRRALDDVDMVWGDMQIYHHFGVGDHRARRPLFSLANILEPGFFDQERMNDDMQTPGLVLFMRLPGPVEGRIAFELMLNTGQRLAQVLGGELRDETRSVLTVQTITHLRERIAEFSRKRLAVAG